PVANQAGGKIHADYDPTKHELTYGDFQIIAGGAIDLANLLNAVPGSSSGGTALDLAKALGVSAASIFNAQVTSIVGAINASFADLFNAGVNLAQSPVKPIIHLYPSTGGQVPADAGKVAIDITDLSATATAGGFSASISHAHGGTNGVVAASSSATEFTAN